MHAELSTEILPSELAQIVESVFETMMNLGVAPTAARWFPSTDRLTAAVHMTGDWNGAVQLECSRGQACRLAGRFLSMDPPPDAVDDLVRDVLGELANMIGGNLRYVLTRGIRLSMPVVLDGGSDCLHVCGAEVRERLSLRCAEGDFWVSVIAT